MSTIIFLQLLQYCNISLSNETVSTPPVLEEPLNANAKIG